MHIPQICKDTWTEATKIPKYLKTLVSGANGRDKVIKAGAAYFDAAAAASEYGGGPENVTAGLKFTARAFKDARMAFALVNIFAGAIFDLIDSIKNFGSLIIHMAEDDHAVNKLGATKRFKGHNLNKPRFNKLHAEQHSYHTWHEKLLGLVIEGLQGLAQTAYIIAFGGFRPTMFFSRSFPNKNAMRTSHLGFGLCMTINHASKLITTGLDLIHETIVFVRYRTFAQGGDVDFDTGDYEAYSGVQALLEDIKWQYIDVVVDAILVCCEKGLEFAKDILILAKVRVHPAVFITLNTLIGTFSLVHACKHAVNATNR